MSLSIHVITRARPDLTVGARLAGAALAAVEPPSEVLVEDVDGGRSLVRGHARVQVRETPQAHLDDPVEYELGLAPARNVESRLLALVVAAALAVGFDGRVLDEIDAPMQPAAAEVLSVCLTSSLTTAAARWNTLRDGW